MNMSCKGMSYVNGYIMWMDLIRKWICHVNGCVMKMDVSCKLMCWDREAGGGGRREAGGRRGCIQNQNPHIGEWWEIWSMLKSCFDELNQEFSVCWSFWSTLCIFKSREMSFHDWNMVKIDMMFWRLNQESSVCWSFCTTLCIFKLNGNAASWQNNDQQRNHVLTKEIRSFR